MGRGGRLTPHEEPSVAAFAKAGPSADRAGACASPRTSPSSVGEHALGGTERGRAAPQGGAGDGLLRSGGAAIANCARGAAGGAELGREFGVCGWGAPPTDRWTST